MGALRRRTVKLEIPFEKQQPGSYHASFTHQGPFVCNGYLFLKSTIRRILMSGSLTIPPTEVCSSTDEGGTRAGQNCFKGIGQEKNFFSLKLQRDAGVCATPDNATYPHGLSTKASTPPSSWCRVEPAYVKSNVTSGRPPRSVCSTSRWSGFQTWRAFR